MVHERWREDARCAIEVLAKLVWLIVLLAALITGAADHVLEVVKAVLSAA